MFVQVCYTYNLEVRTNRPCIVVFVVLMEDGFMLVLLSLLGLLSSVVLAIMVTVAVVDYVVMCIAVCFARVFLVSCGQYCCSIFTTVACLSAFHQTSESLFQISLLYSPKTTLADLRTSSATVHVFIKVLV